MTYSQTIDFLFSTLPMFSRVGAVAYKKDLTNTILLCNHLQNPQNNFKSIHIAGTNGKGSTSHMLASILQQQGFKVGLYTSPHLKDFRERIKINGQLCSKQFVIDFVENHKLFFENISPSFFEVTVAMAFAYFNQENVDFAVIETGLGGRLDSTNIINPILSVITNIGFDHMSILGNTLPQIAFEKGGIIKKNTPVVIGEKNVLTTNVFIEKAKNENAKIYFAEDLYSTVYENQFENYFEVDLLNNSTNNIEKYLLDLCGLYQSKNLKTVLSSCLQLNSLGVNLSIDNIKTGLKQIVINTGFMGRWQVISKNPLVVLDVAHNEDGINQLLLQLKTIEYNNLHIVLGMVKDKDVDAVLNLLPLNAIYYFTNSQIERALPAIDLQKKALNFNLNGNKYSDVNKALKEARQKADNNDLILVCGSVFLVGEVNF